MSTKLEKKNKTKLKILTDIKMAPYGTDEIEQLIILPSYMPFYFLTKE